MKVELIYSKVQVDCAVGFIADNNPTFTGLRESIRSSIFHHMREMAKSGSRYTSTMGWTLIAEYSDENLDTDKNVIYFYLSVDPALGVSQHTEDEYTSESIVVEDK